MSHAAPRPGGREQFSRVRLLLEPRGLVDRRARHERVPGHDLPGRDADASSEDGRAEREGRRDRAERVVVLRSGDAEHAEHAPAAERRDARAVTFELPLRRDRPLQDRRAPCLRVVGRVGRCDVGDEDRHELPRLRGLRPRGRRGRAVRRVERGILAQHRPLQLLQLAPGVGSQLVDERAARVGVGLQRVRLSPRAIERDDELPSQPLAVRLAGDELLQLGDELHVAAERKVGVDPLLERREAELVEVRGRLARRLSCEIGERGTAPEREGLSQAVGGGGRLGAVGLLDEVPERVEIELARRDAEEVPGRPRDEPVAELATQPHQVVLERRLRRRRRIVAPDAVDEAVDRDDAVCLEQQQAEHRAPPQAADRDDALAGPHLERAEDPELHLADRRVHGDVDAGGRHLRIRRLCARHGVERRVLLQHEPLELLQPRRRVDPELVLQHPPEALERFQRLRMPAAAVESEHQLPSQPFPERMAADERVELGDELRVPAERQLGVDALLQAREVLLDEPRLLQPGERLRELGERRAAPQRQRTPQRGGGIVRAAVRERVASLRVETLEGTQIERVAVEVEAVPR